jgi:hypothetical protein
MERIKDIEKIKSLGIDPEAEMAINCEWVRCLSWLHAYNSFPDRVHSILSSMNIFLGPGTTPLLMSHLTNLANKLSR